jgi:multimeric flavodoxin WrbA
MKIVAIMGSPHGMHGNTGRLLDEVIAGVEGQPKGSCLNPVQF